MTPPKVMVEAGVCKPRERWRVHRALYGFTSSPAHWAIYRDSTLEKMTWMDGDQPFFLQSTAEGNLWKIMKGKKDEGSPGCVGHVIVYVDDIMALSTPEIREGFFQRVKQEWKCSDVETVGQDQWTRFCGFELKWKNDTQLMIGQESYTRELLKRHQRGSCWNDTRMLSPEVVPCRRLISPKK